VQNHLLQVLSLLTMEPPASFDAEAVRDEQVKLLKAVRPFDPKRMVRAQYTRGRVGAREVPGYGDEENVASGTDIETFVAVRVAIENWRWAGVPIYLRTGKRLPLSATEIEVGFKDVPAPFFEASGVETLQPNTLTLSIQPQEQITFSFLAKVPGPQIGVKPVEMNFSYDSTATADAYERLILDAIEGDQTLFVRADSVERAWQIVQPALDQPPPLHLYEAGTWGPEEADELIAPVRWHLR
jgi:glucose-6-phosphate 1-dehydrogenase